MRRSRKTAVLVAAGAALVVLPATPAGAGGGHGHGAPVSTVAGGLDGPRQLSDYRGDRVVVAESGSGEVSSVSLRSGRVETLLSGLATPQGVDYDRGRLYVATGEAGPPAEGEEPAPPLPGASSLVVAEPGGEVLQTIDLLAYELAANPDGQLQFGPDGAPVDALSNPYAVLAQGRRVLVADAGANAVLSVDRHSGEVSTFFVPPLVTDVPGCAGAENNPGTVGCDPVPTGIAEGPWGEVYVSTLGADVPGAGRVYVLSPRGRVLDVIEGLTAPTGLAVDRRGTVYVSNVGEGAPEGEPGPDFDPATVGEVTKVTRHGERSTAQVTMPTGLLARDGGLYASAWSVTEFLGLPADAGEVVRVGRGAFTPVGG
ncbi:ScyD/ScyE family protein [Modestobacter sp. L9-4]|uniref:ScyD/ScyE family protein n=1 Tax=Modestobacter sp. L9-4 TaxID=2851567 RepID=UPI001C7707E5|nr:ScyD/ScyE family protein [Modestobacter sp. L9-4]QXG76360.1 ScyD/ScyE family protein [Modestobacter sp. L9-4]